MVAEAIRLIKNNRMFPYFVIGAIAVSTFMYLVLLITAAREFSILFHMYGKEMVASTASLKMKFLFNVGVMLGLTIGMFPLMVMLLMLPKWMVQALGLSLREARTLSLVPLAILLACMFIVTMHIFGVWVG